MNDHIRQALHDVVTHCPDPHAVVYAQKAIDLDMKGEALVTQILYVRSNLMHWRGEMARSTKATLLRG